MKIIIALFLLTIGMIAYGGSPEIAFSILFTAMLGISFYLGYHIKDWEIKK
jgi:hypothetical protein